MEEEKYYCYLCGKELTDENKSDEHIILNAIGGHLHSYTLKTEAFLKSKSSLHFQTRYNDIGVICLYLSLLSVFISRETELLRLFFCYINVTINAKFLHVSAFLYADSVPAGTYNVADEYTSPAKADEFR